MSTKYKYVDGKKVVVVNNYDLGSDLIPDISDGQLLPDVDSGDNGKLLGVDDGEWKPVNAPTELPSTSGNAGKVLKVNSGATGVEWGDVESELPAVTNPDIGDVLTVVADGSGAKWGKAAPCNFELTFTLDWDDNTSSFIVLCDKTYQELKSSYDNGKIIDAHFINGADKYYCSFMGFDHFDAWGTEPAEDMFTFLVNSPLPSVSFDVTVTNPKLQCLYAKITWSDNGTVSLGVNAQFYEFSVSQINW